MWTSHLTRTIKRSQKQEPLTNHLVKKIHEQYNKMSPRERWTAISITVNKTNLQKIVKNNSPAEVFEEEFEDTIYTCEKCGSKKIDIYQKQLRGAVSFKNMFQIILKNNSKSIPSYF